MGLYSFLICLVTSCETLVNELVVHKPAYYWYFDEDQYFPWNTARLMSGQNSFMTLKAPSKPTCVPQR
jgi:hypothetical protein